MANTDGMAHKFRVIKEDDVKKYLSDKERFALNHLQTIIALGRESEGKPNSNEYLVVNTDESYADDIIDILKKNGDWGKTDNVPSIEKFISRQVNFYLDEEQITLNENEQQQLKDNMVELVVGRIGISSWHFNAEVFRFDMERAIREILENRTDETDSNELSHDEINCETRKLNGD